MGRAIPRFLFSGISLFSGSQSIGAAEGRFAVAAAPDFPTHWDHNDSGFIILAEQANDIAGPPGHPRLPWKLEVLHASGAPASWRLKIVEADTVFLPGPLAWWNMDLLTSDTARSQIAVPADERIYTTNGTYPTEDLRLLSSGQIGQRRLASFLWCPYRYNPVTHELISIRRAIIVIGNQVDASPSDPAIDTAPAGDLLLDAFTENLTTDRSSEYPVSGSDSTSWWHLSAGAPLGVEYVVVTSAAFVSAVSPLVRWKAARGIRSGVATIGDIVAQYPAIDAAASVREYLKAAYASGLKWVVLGGDETVAPVRVAYAEHPAYNGDPYHLHQCDLYFAELNGNWDADGDGVWGEFIGDQAELFPELHVGRLPYSTIAEAQTIVQKIIAYEAGPVAGTYLTRSLSVSTDQFRDWNSGVGQQGLVAASMPTSWTNDLSTMIESPSGSDPAPVNPGGTTFGDALTQGYGWVNYFVHGRADAFVVRSAGIMDWPRTYVFTDGNGGDGHGYLNLVTPSATPGIHLSAACDQGGFDLDAPPYPPGTGESVAEKLLFMPGGGAVAFVGQSRWGWVSTSYKLIQKFYDYVDGPSVPNHVGVYQSLASLAHSSYRDLVYGNNLYGDPEMPVWVSAPKALSLSAPTTFSPGSSAWTVQAYGSSGAIAGAVVTLAIGDSVWMLGTTGIGGNLPVQITLPFAEAAILTASKTGHRVWCDTLPVSIISDVFDDGDVVPSSYVTLDNYPNPFNSSTVISFSLTNDSDVRLDVFNVLGRRIATLVDGVIPAGKHQLNWDASGLASGVYFTRLATGGIQVMRKLVLVR